MVFIFWQHNFAISSRGKHNTLGTIFNFVDILNVLYCKMMREQSMWHFFCYNCSTVYDTSFIYLWCFTLNYIFLFLQFVARLTTDIVQTFGKCNPEFKYSDSLNPKRFLTNPSVPAHNDGLDNANSDLILYVNLELVNKKSDRRLVFFLTC